MSERKPARILWLRPFSTWYGCETVKYLFNWNAPIIWSKHEPNTYYHGISILLKTSDMGYRGRISPYFPATKKEKKQGKLGHTQTKQSVPITMDAELHHGVTSRKRGDSDSSDTAFYLTRDGAQLGKIEPHPGWQNVLINPLKYPRMTKGTVYIVQRY